MPRFESSAARRSLSFLAIACILIGKTATTNAEEPGWFPHQAAPRSIARTIRDDRFPEPHLALSMMVQSVAGLAARAVNEGRGDEMVWVATSNPDVERWYAGWLARNPSIVVHQGEFTPWDLVDRYRERGVIKGYIVYRLDRSVGEINEHRPDMDLSVNVATSMAGLLDGILIDESLEAEAKAHGLSLLLDAREKSQQWCFETYKDRFNRRMLCTQDPRKTNIRDLTIAQQTLMIYGNGEPLGEVLKWLEPPAPIMGWNGGDEFKTTLASTIHGHFQTATDWCVNLPVLMAGSVATEPSGKAKRLDPRGIDWNDRRSAVSFVSTDGDNVQWLEGNFFASQSYWGDPNRGRIPFGWSCCFAHLAQLCPPAMEHALSTQAGNDRFLEWGGGYYYPDHFAKERPDRWELLALHARRTWALMRANGTPVIGFNVANPESADARKAFEVFARETDGLLAILVFQYDPYEGGAGKMAWVKDGRGVEVPVISARYSIWEHRNKRPRSGTPAKVAREIRETVAATPEADLPRYDWAIAHVWSYFRQAPGDDEDAENLPQTDAPSHGGVRGYTPVTWCAERLPETIRVVDLEELIWRIRMKHDLDQTKAAIEEFRP